jgi:hypothetical protein
MSLCQHEDCEREAVAQWNGCVFCDEHVRERLRTTADSKLRSGRTPRPRCDGCAAEELG